MGAGHSHRAHRGGEADLEVARGPKLALLTGLAIAAVAAVVGLALLWPSGAAVSAVTDDVDFAAPGVTFPTALVDAVRPACASATDRGQRIDDCGTLQVTVDEGAGRGDSATVPVPPEVAASGLQPGDVVKLQRVPGQGGDPAYSYFGTERTSTLLVLLLVFVVLVVLVARWRGLFALAGLAFSGLVVWRFMLPALLTGGSGLLVGLTGAAAIMFVVLYTTHGFSLRTSTALAGTLIGVLVTAGLGVLATDAARVTGVGVDTASILSTFVDDLSFQGLYACAIVIAGLGVLNDVTVTQASSVWEIRAAAPAMSRTAVFASGMRIGRDHIASTIYTIVFAYAGTALAVLLVLQLYGLPVGDLLATEEVTQELVRTLASSIGLVLAVPLTTGIAALVVPGPREVSLVE
jgi:uncharacterized membrane protein